jgi:predicted TIM-barrel fold metal-dependent hydrolase
MTTKQEGEGTMEKDGRKGGRVLLVSSDCHGGIPTQQYREYMESRYHPLLDEYERWQQDGYQKEYFERPVSSQAWIPSRVRVADSTRFADSAGRLADLEENGVVSEVIFPTASAATQPPWSDFLSGGSFRSRTPAARELQAIGEKAYNRWIAEFCQAVPRDRRLGLAFLPMHDPIAAVSEAKWAAESGLRGVVMPFYNHDLPEYSNTYWEPIWSVCEDLNLTLNFHGGYGIPEMGEFTFLSVLQTQVWPTRMMALMIFSGVFDRHPNLHATITEARASWVPDSMAIFDRFVDDATSSTNVNNVLLAGRVDKLPKRRPSEYWFDNWFAGSSITNVEEMTRRHEIGIQTLLYGIDYPHPEGAWGQATTWISAAFGEAGVTEEETRLILGQNAARLYGLNLNDLAPVVDRIGPTIDDVMADVDQEQLDALFEEARNNDRELGPASYKREQVDLSRQL